MSILSFVDKDQLEPGCSVLLNHKVRGGGRAIRPLGTMFYVHVKLLKQIECSNMYQLVCVVLRILMERVDGFLRRFTCVSNGHECNL